MRASLNDYELGLIGEFGEDRVPLEAINFIRWIKAVKCEGDEATRRREYPCRPEEAFEYSAETVLDPAILSLWTKAAHELHPKQVRFTILEDKRGNVEVSFEEDTIGRCFLYEMPDPEKSYVMGVDAATGGHTEQHDFTVAVILEVEGGHQIAEFRAKMDQDQAIDQIEALGIFYNRAFTGVEANSYGMPYVKELESRSQLPMYEREVLDRKEPGKLTKRIGWMTNAQTRNMVFTEIRRAVRENRNQIKSLVTLSECRTLVVSRSEQSRMERIEARSGCHDDGVMAYGIALMMRNRCISPGSFDDGEEKEIEAEDINLIVKRMMNASGMVTRKAGPRIPLTLNRKHIKGGSGLIDGRRSVL